MTIATNNVPFKLTEANARDLKLGFTQYENEVRQVGEAQEIAKSKLEHLAKKIVTLIGDAGIKTGEGTDAALAIMRDVCVRTDKGKEIRASANLWNRAVKAAFDFTGSTLVESKERKAQSETKARVAKEKAIAKQAETLGCTKDRVEWVERFASQLLTDDLMYLNVTGLLGAMGRGAKSYGIKARLAAEEVAALHPVVKAA